MNPKVPRIELSSDLCVEISDYLVATVRRILNTVVIHSIPVKRDYFRVKEIFFSFSEIEHQCFQVTKRMDPYFKF